MYDLELRARQIAMIPGLTWQQRISELSSEFGISAIESAEALGRNYISMEESADLIAQNFLGTIDPQIQTFLEQMASFPIDEITRVNHVAQQLGVSQNVAKELLFPYQARLRGELY